MAVTSEVALSHMMVLKTEVDMASHNLANANTAGFWQRYVPHYEYKSPKQGNNFSYVHTPLMVRDTRPGPFKRTDDPYHMYLKGDGYFAVQTPNGVRYTRAGAFTLNAQSQLVTPAGHLVLDEGQGPITLPEGDIHIRVASDGTISNKGGTIAKLGVFAFENPHDLYDEEDTLVNTNQAPALASKAGVLQYGYEGSNVETIREVTRLINLMTAYQQAEKLVEEQNKLATKVTETIGRSLQI